MVRHRGSVTVPTAECLCSYGRQWIVLVGFTEWCPLTYHVYRQYEGGIAVIEYSPNSETIGIRARKHVHAVGTWCVHRPAFIPGRCRGGGGVMISVPFKWNEFSPHVRKIFRTWCTFLIMLFCGITIQECVYLLYLWSRSNLPSTHFWWPSYAPGS